MFNILNLAVLALPITLGILDPVPARSQPAPVVSGRTFEVASVKLADPNASGTSVNLVPGGGMRVTNATLRDLLRFAYGVREPEIAGGPTWIGSLRFDIVAKSEQSGENTDPASMNDAQKAEFQDLLRERMRSLLADRFRLIAHRELKEMPIFALVITKGGHKLRESPDQNNGPRNFRMRRGEITGERINMPSLAGNLSRLLERPVVDRTALARSYDFKVEWVEESTPAVSDANGAGEPVSARLPSGPSLFTALQEQLGLRLESGRAPVEILFIDSAEKPSVN